MGDIVAPSYIESLGNELLAKYRRLDSVLTHAPSKGTYHEKILRNMLKGYLPSTFSVGEGFIINQQAVTSPQLDILVVDNLDPRSFGYKEDDFFIASDLAACCFGEVKTMPTRSEFIKAFHKLAQASQVLELPGRTTSFMFCYDAPVGKKAFFGWLQKALESLPDPDNTKPWHLPDYIFCLKLGIMQERRYISGRSVQYFDVSSKNDDSNIVQQKIIQDIFQCVINGCGRLRAEQNIKLQRD